MLNLQIFLFRKRIDSKIQNNGSNHIYIECMLWQSFTRTSNYTKRLFEGKPICRFSERGQYSYSISSLIVLETDEITRKMVSKKM
jgi:hypothetical protein